MIAASVREILYRSGIHPKCAGSERRQAVSMGYYSLMKRDAGRRCFHDLILRGLVGVEADYVNAGAA
jgi:hypothetical protein